jgi:carbon storage regulator CsrA
MLVLSRKAGQSVRIGRDVTVKMLSGSGRVGIDAPQRVHITRGEIAPPSNGVYMAQDSTTAALVSLVEAYLRATARPFRRLCVDHRRGVVDDLGSYATVASAMEACEGDFEALDPKYRTACLDQTEFIVGPLRVERIATWYWDDADSRVVMVVSTASSEKSPSLPATAS